MLIIRLRVMTCLISARLLWFNLKVLANRVLVRCDVYKLLLLNEFVVDTRRCLICGGLYMCTPGKRRCTKLLLKVV